MAGFLRNPLRLMPILGAQVADINVCRAEGATRHAAARVSTKPGHLKWPNPYGDLRGLVNESNGAKGPMATLVAGFRRNPRRNILRSALGAADIYVSNMPAVKRHWGQGVSPKPGH